MKSSKNRKKMKNLKKSIKHFIKDEDGFIEKDKIIKIGLGTISALTVISSLSDPKNAYAQTHTNENNHASGIVEQDVPGTHCKKFVHSNGTIHNNHSQGGK